MLKVKEFMIKKLVTVEQDKKISDVTKKMTDNSISSVIVVENKKPVGIITERDLVKKILLEQKNPRNICAKDIMTKKIETIDAEYDFTEAVQLMKKKHIRRLVVVENNIVAGIITETDLVNAVDKLHQNLDNELSTGNITSKHHSKIKKDLNTIKQLYEKADTGSAELNRILEGGYPQGGNILLEGQPGSGKSLLMYSFLKAGLEKGEKCVYVYSNQPYENMVKAFSSIGFDAKPYIRKNLLVLINMVTKEHQKIKDVISCNFDNLSSLSDIIDDINNKSACRMRCVIGVLSQALLLWDPNTIYRFILDLSEQFKEKKITALYVIEKGMHDQKDIIAIEQLMDGVIDFIEKEVVTDVNKYISVKKMEGGNIINQKYLSFEFNKNGSLVLKES